MKYTTYKEVEWRQSLHPEYEINEFGEMRALTERYRRPVGTIIRGTKQKGGYVRYNLVSPDDCGRGSKKMHLSAHRLVLHAFVGPPPTTDHQVAHYDGNPSNNHYSNLRWATAAENTADKIRHGRHRKGNRKLTADDVIDIRARNQAGESYNSLCKLYKTTKSNISSIINRKTWDYLDDKTTEETIKRIKESKMNKEVEWQQRQYPEAKGSEVRYPIRSLMERTAGSKASYGSPIRKRHGNQKLTAEDVIDIRARSQAGQAQYSIAKIYGISQAHISNIINRKTWDYLDDMTTKEHNHACKQSYGRTLNMNSENFLILNVLKSERELLEMKITYPLEEGASELIYALQYIDNRIKELKREQDVD